MTPRLHTKYSITPPQDDQNNGDDRKTGQVLPDWEVEYRMTGLVHSEELEDEVGKATDVHENGEDHADLVLVARPDGCHEQNQDGDGNGGYGKAKFAIREAGDNDEELDGEAEEEEEIKFEEGDINLTIIC
ncbi:hypothetical protein B7463_g9689, partial [Scytalidium lignicola]